MIIVARGAEAVSVALLAGVAALLPWMHDAGAGPVLLVACLGTAQLVWGMAMGAESPLEMGFWQALTPETMIARMSSVRRSANRGMIVLGAPLGGLIATGAGVAIALWVAAAFVALGMVLLAASQFRSVRIEDSVLDDEARDAE